MYLTGYWHLMELGRAVNIQVFLIIECLSIIYLFLEQLSVPGVINPVSGEYRLCHRQLSHCFYICYPYVWSLAMCCAQAIHHLLTLFVLAKLFHVVAYVQLHTDLCLEILQSYCFLHFVGCLQVQWHESPFILSLSTRCYMYFNYNWGMFPGAVAWASLL